MAALNHHRSGSRISQNGGNNADQLPGGSCNYRDLSTGARAPMCGCKRFWLNGDHYNGHAGNTERAWCFCGHHACFHNAFNQRQQGLSQVSLGFAGDGVANTAPWVDQTVQSQMQAQANTSPPGPAGLGIRPSSPPESQSINTRLWNAFNAFARNQEDGPASDATSKLPSTACPSVVGEPRLSPSRMMLERTQHLRPMAPPVNIPHSDHVNTGTEEYSATEVATPSAIGTPDFRAFPAPVSQTRASPSNLLPTNFAPARATGLRHGDSGVDAQPKTATDRSASQPTPVIHPVPSLGQDLGNLMRSLGQRVDALESLSFSHVPLEEVHDKFESIDGRLLDLEQWRTDQDQVHSDPEPAGPSSSKRRRLLPTETSSFASDGSFDSAAAAHTEAAVLATLAANAETGPRIEALEGRVADLENSALPSFARPWQVQVVLLPWGRDLRGVWFSALEATQQSLRSSTQASEEWTGAQSTPKLSFKSANGAWTTESIQAWANDAQEWLSPKACGPTGQVFQRLASRGLVQDVTLTSSDSRHVLEAVDQAFADDLRSFGERKQHEGPYQALRESFVPLRKYRKSSRLRFLSPAEVTTSATWTAGFLNSVCMKINDGQRRLYLTTPEAYLQSAEPGWTWQALRKLPIHDARGDEQEAQVTNAAIEACWTYNDRLDHPISTAASFAVSHHSEPSQTSHSGEVETRNLERAPSSLSERRDLHSRAVSLLSSASNVNQSGAILPKRRVASFDTTATAPIDTNNAMIAGGAKRRRTSPSPEAERRGVGFTPRRSREPPSPFTSEHAGEGQSQSNASRIRGMTPFAYATPHSNSNYVGRVDFNSGDGDTEADTEMAVPQSEHADDEWQGVEDATTPAMLPGDRESAQDESEIDEENLDEGLTIYEA